MQFKPQKAKTLGKDKIQLQATDEWLVSTKYDGHQVFVVKHNGTVKCFTSGWKQFSHSLIEQQALELPGDFVLIGEFLYDCRGVLGCREKSAILTTFRTNFNKGICNSIRDEQLSYIKVFDRLPIGNNTLITHIGAEDRIERIQTTNNMYKVNFLKKSLKEAERLAKALYQEGYEGLMCLHPDSYYHIGKRVHHAIKIKPRLTADLLCIDTLKGEGKYSEMIGSLMLQDSKGRIVYVGSGLTDLDRKHIPDFYKGQVIEIEYEKLADTYIQPTFKCVRYDKQPDEID